MLLNPRLIFEVLSESTEANDRGWKASHYRQLGSLAEYVLVAQDHPHVEQYTRQPDGTWLFREYRSLDDVMSLPSIASELSLSDIYRIEELDEE
jgi:Uma2 family endonuclease